MLVAQIGKKFKKFAVQTTFFGQIGKSGFIKNADQLNLVGIAKTVNDLANRARNNSLNPDDIAGGTYTVTNVGIFGSIMGTPIINQPQVGILAFGAIRKMPSVIETEKGDDNECPF